MATLWTRKAAVSRAEFTPRRSGSQPCWNAITARRCRFKIVEEVLRTGIFTANGKPVDYSDEVEEALAPLRSATLNLIS